MVILRLLLWMPQPLHFFFGISKVGFWTHFWGSLVGYPPTLLAVSYLGNTMFDTSGQLQPEAWPIFVGMLVASVAVAAVARLLERRRRSASAV